MDAAARLRALAAQCRTMAASLKARHTAETLRYMAREFEAAALASDQPPIFTAPPGQGRRKVQGVGR